MARYAGRIGFATMCEQSRGKLVETIVERPYRGDVLRHVRQNEGGETLNDNVDVSNEISIVADPYVYSNLGRMRYVTWMGTKWKVTSVTVDRPRVSISIGGVYNEQTP